VNWRVIGFVLGALCLLSAAAMLPSLGIAAFGEETGEVRSRMVRVFTGVIGFSVLLGLVLRRTTRRHQKGRITPTEGFAVATFGWILMATLGGLPYVLARNGVPGEPDGIGTSPGRHLTMAEACFESMSGYTTTGSSVFGTPLEDGGYGRIESMPKSLLFWRSMTHWLGGMGIVLLVLAVLPALRAGGYQLFQAEVPGPTAERLKPRIRETAAILWGVYVLLSVAETLLLWVGGMPLFEGICHTFGTMATGGFSPKDASIGHYARTGHPHALYFEVVINVFMFLAGCNFLLHYSALHGRVRDYWRNAEFRQYFFFLAGGILLITFLNRLGTYATVGESFRKSAFHVLSITTTTGYVTDDFNLWPGVCRILLLIFMFCGGCAGSTGGGLKQMRVLVVAKYIYRELLKLLRPSLISRIRVGDATLEERTCASVMGLAMLWVVVFAAATMAVLFFAGGVTPPDSQFVTSLSSVAATLNNIGPGLGDVGATANYGWYPAPAKIILLLCMLMGRLEIYSVIVLLVASVRPARRA
jgi:trk system potassium uptake protein TrkH